MCITLKTYVHNADNIKRMCSAYETHIIFSLFSFFCIILFHFNSMSFVWIHWWAHWNSFNNDVNSHFTRSLLCDNLPIESDKVGQQKVASNHNAVRGMDIQFCIFYNARVEYWPQQIHTGRIFDQLQLRLFGRQCTGQNFYVHIFYWRLVHSTHHYHLLLCAHHEGGQFSG